MLDIRTILCPIDFTPLSDRTLRVAVSLSHWFKARLVLHHNVDPSPPDFLSVGWMWSEDHELERRESEHAAPERLQAMLAKRPSEIPAEAKLTHGSLGRSVLEVAQRLPADLIVMGTHGWSSAEHNSLAEQLISSAPCTVLTTNEN